MKRSIPLFAALGAATLTALSAHALTREGVVLEPKTYNQVTVVSGGIGLDESTAIKQMSKQYPLRIVLTNPVGDYQVADSLQVMQNGQVVADIPGAGPYILMNMPAGRYTLHANFAGRQMTRDVTVSSSGRKEVSLVTPSSLG